MTTQHDRRALTAEERRLEEDDERRANWKRWGPYLSERQWGTVREDYSAEGTAWDSFPHDHARSRAYRWGEDGLLGIADRQCRLCFALALWNGRDTILKERLFGLSGKEGNHGEDVKEAYFYLDSTPTHSYLKALYKYPWSAFPYERLVGENARRGQALGELELADTGAFDQGRYFDVLVEYAKAAPEDLCIRVTISNRGREDAPLHVLPTLWFRNTWSWGRGGEEHGPEPRLRAIGDASIAAEHATLGTMHLELGPGPTGELPQLLFTRNETNAARLFGAPANGPSKDAFHEYVVEGRTDAVSPTPSGTKACGLYRLDVPAGGTVELRLRLFAAEGARRTGGAPELGRGFERTFAERIREADAFYGRHIPASLGDEERLVARQAYAGLLWSKQFYHYVVEHWLEGDPAQPAPPPGRRRNADWTHLYSRDVLSMPDKWEFPWFASWDTAFHMIPFARVDAGFAKHQLELLLREWYMHPNGQIPAYEWALSDVNPPVHAWACWRVYKKTGARGKRDLRFLKSVFQKLVLNFTWWVNRKDTTGRHVFSGGFLGLDNIGVFDRSAPLPGGARLDQADGTAWMAFYCGTMLSMALELARHDASYEDMASKFFEHFIAIADAMNHLGGTGLWNEDDGFYYDEMHVGERVIPLRVRSLVGLIPLIAVEVIDQETIARLPGFRKRMEWFLRNRPDLGRRIGYMECSADCAEREGHRLLAIPSRERLVRVLGYMLDERELLSPHGIRSLSKHYRDEPFELTLDGQSWRLSYTPGESDTWLFGGNSNWRGPVWFPINFLLIEALERWHYFYGDGFQVECPTGSGRRMSLAAVAAELSRRLTSLFEPDGTGSRPCHGDDPRFRDDPHWRDLVLFYEHFHGDTGRGVGASHQTGWTALVATLLESLAPAQAEHELGKRAALGRR